MPYKFERKRQLIPREPGKDKRIKLTEEQREAIRKDETTSRTDLAKRYGVSRHLVRLIQDPDAKTRMLQKREERGGSKSYYDPKRHRETMKRHRQHKKALADKGLLEERTKSHDPDRRTARRRLAREHRQVPRAGLPDAGGHPVA